MFLGFKVVFDFGVFVNLKFNNFDDEKFPSNIKKSLIDASNKGAIGLKIYKNLGLDLKDLKGNRIKIDEQWKWKWKWNQSH